ncbi:MAG: helix-turn-helix domain-containing protein [Wenzhouxiangellaceae bacterium]
MNNQVPEREISETFVVTTLEQARLLADEFKLRVLDAFAGRPTTVKQVAQQMGEKPTRLYRHVDALLDAGLLRVVDETPKRGTVERTMQAVAARFEADPALFRTGSASEREHAIREQFRLAADSFLHALADPPGPDESLEPICLRVLNRASPERMRELHRLLLEWVERAAEDRDTDEIHGRRFNALVVFNADDSGSAL